MRILDLALKDLSQMFRDKRSLLFLVAMPIVFTFFMGFAYGSSTQTDENADTRLPLAIVDPEPDATLNQMLETRLVASTTLKPIPLTEPEAMDAFHKGDVAGVLVIPLGFSERSEAGDIPQLTLIAEAASSQGQTLYQALRVPVSQLMSAVQAARLSAAEQSNPAEYSPALALAWSK